jgi:hypothetical protein
LTVTFSIRGLSMEFLSHFRGGFSSTNSISLW